MSRPRSALRPKRPRPLAPLGGAPGSARRRHIRRTFDEETEREWRRYAGTPRRRLWRALRERFLVTHLPPRATSLLELGPGPGRFTPRLLLRASRRLLLADLSPGSLGAARRRIRRAPGAERAAFLRAAGEHLPLRDRSVDGTVALGNIVSFAAADGPRLLAEIARVTRPGGFLVADFPSPAASIQEFFHVLAESRRLRRVLRRPGYYLVDRVLDRGDQPRDPRRYARWEFRFYTAEEARRAVEAAGLAVRDLLAIAPIAAHQPLIAQVARQERRTWEELLRLEEKVGRRPGTLETGQGFVVFAVSRTSGRPARDGSRRPRAA